ncbi:hypothetical protein AOLI_G00136900 [Acnodon oligacanthus]
MWLLPQVDMQMEMFPDEISQVSCPERVFPDQFAQVNIPRESICVALLESDSIITARLRQQLRLKLPAPKSLSRSNITPATRSQSVPESRVFNHRVWLTRFYRKTPRERNLSLTAARTQF